MNQQQSIEDIIASGRTILQALADNSIACEWLVRIEAAHTSQKKLFHFGEMRVALMADTRPEAREVLERMFPKS
jgi:hypothetical protein